MVSALTATRDGTMRSDAAGRSKLNSAGLLPWFAVRGDRRAAVSIFNLDADLPR